ncbi:Fanconi anemia core complex-associated protein 100 isoform 1-T1 [Mantella aurantiaca]
MEQLVQFQCPASRLPGSKGCIASWNGDLYVCNGNEFLYVFCLEKKLITAVYLFPSKISHMELDTSNRQLYILCSHSGIFLLEWDEMGRLLQEPKSITQRGGMTIHHIGPSFCCLQDPCAASFTLACDVLVLAVQQSYEWKAKVFSRKSLCYEDPNPLPAREIKLVGKVATTNTHLQPVFCCVSLWKENKGNGDPSNYLLEARLFTRLFGVDLAMFDSPIILCGFPDGRVAYFPLKSSGSCYENQSSLKLLYHLEQPVVSVGATKTGSRDEGAEQPIRSSVKTPCDCVLLIGQKGSMVSVMSGGESEGAACEYRKHPVKAPVFCTLYSTAGVIYSNHSDLFSMTIPSAEDRTTTSAPRCSIVSPVRHNIPMIAAMSENIQSSDGTDLVLLSSRGRLMLFRLNQKESRGPKPGLESDNTGHKIKELLSGIGSVSDRVSRLKLTVSEKRSSLQKLNQVMSLSRQLVSGDWTSGPLQCDVTASWSRMLQTDCITVSCTLENRTDCVLDRGWTLCALINSDISYSFRLTSLKPGERTELAFPLPTHAYHSLNFPIKITFTLFYNLKELVTDSALPADSCLAQQGICIPLQEHSIDLLQCLRSGPPASHPDPLHVMPEDVIQVFVKTSSAGTNRSDHPDMRSVQGVKSSAPLKARIHISASLLAQALQNGKSGRPLCSAVLHWLLSVDMMEQSLVEVQGVTPDGKDFSLQVQEITVSDLASEGSIQAIEIQILSSHLLVVASLHLAVINRFQILFQLKKNVCHTPDLDLGKVQQQFRTQESLLKELKTLKERLDVDEDVISNAAAERLLHIYRELRDPGLFFI